MNPIESAIVHGIRLRIGSGHGPNDNGHGPIDGRNGPIVEGHASEVDQLLEALYQTELNFGFNFPNRMLSNRTN